MHGISALIKWAPDSIFFLPPRTEPGYSHLGSMKLAPTRLHIRGILNIPRGGICVSSKTRHYRAVFL